MQRLENTVSKVSHFKAVTVDFSIKKHSETYGDVCLSLSENAGENETPQSELFHTAKRCNNISSPREFPVWFKQCLIVTGDSAPEGGLCGSQCLHHAFDEAGFQVND